MDNPAYQAYPEENTARLEIVDAGRRLYMRGAVCANDGNISVRISDNAILATPTGVSKGFMTPDMLVTLDLEGNILGGALKPSSEIKMHLAILRKSRSINAVCHAHPPVASAFAAAGVALDMAYLQETAMLMGVIPVAGYAKPGTDELAINAAGLCEGYHGALLEHHGVVTWGDCVTQALFRMEGVEHAATVAMYSRMMGFTRTLDKEKIDDLVAMRPQWGITAKLGEFRSTE